MAHLLEGKEITVRVNPEVAKVLKSGEFVSTERTGGMGEEGHQCEVRPAASRGTLRHFLTRRGHEARGYASTTARFVAELYASFAKMDVSGEDFERTGTF